MNEAGSDYNPAVMWQTGTPETSGMATIDGEGNFAIPNLSNSLVGPQPMDGWYPPHVVYALVTKSLDALGNAKYGILWLGVDDIVTPDASVEMYASTVRPRMQLPEDTYEVALGLGPNGGVFDKDYGGIELTEGMWETFRPAEATVIDYSGNSKVLDVIATEVFGEDYYGVGVVGWRTQNVIHKTTTMLREGYSGKGPRTTELLEEYHIDTVLSSLNAPIPESEHWDELYDLVELTFNVYQGGDIVGTETWSIAPYVDGEQRQTYGRWSNTESIYASLLQALFSGGDFNVQRYLYLPYNGRVIPVFAGVL
jgi:hypothetical protein